MSTSLHREVERRLSEEGVRYTSGRREVIQKLADGSGPRSAAELSADLGPSVPVSTLYRTLSTLEEVGIVSPHFVTKGVARYELAEWLMGHHHHLVCTNCSTVLDIDVPAEYEAQVHALVEDISAGESFTPANHALEIEGLCKDCA